VKIKKATALEDTMPLPSMLIPARAAVLSMDYQAGVASVYVKDQDFMNRAWRVLAHLRSLGVLLVHVKVQFGLAYQAAGIRTSLLVDVWSESTC
jgi:hypothetical protein